MKQYSIRVNTMSDGNRTVAEATVFRHNESGYIVETVTTGKGSAGREPGDKQSSEVGEKLAVSRALASVEAHLTRQADGRMRNIESNRQHKAEIELNKRLKALADYGRAVEKAGLL